MNRNEPLFVDQICDHDGCNCLVDPGKGIVKDGKNYCCQGCADGTGCENPSCNCHQK